MILYKYMSLDSARQVLESGMIGFSRAIDFNDPFDTPVGVPLQANNASERLFVEIASSAKNLVWEKNSAILCLTRTATNKLMWSHYADRHNGAVIGINMNKAGLAQSEGNMIPAHFGSVIYVKHRPNTPLHSAFGGKIVEVGGTYDFVLEHYEKWQRMFLLKSLEWAYEEEVRVVKCIRSLGPGIFESRSGSGTVIELPNRLLYCFNFDLRAIELICFGSRITESERSNFKRSFPSYRYARAEVDLYGLELSLMPDV